jgi:hypothetical protein
LLNGDNSKQNYLVFSLSLRSPGYDFETPFICKRTPSQQYHDAGYDDWTGAQLVLIIHCLFYGALMLAQHSKS